MLYNVVIIWNILIFFLYGWDKFSAKQSWRRIPEDALIWIPFLLGGWGALFGMVIWNHKTSKMKFRLLIPLAVILNGVLFWLIRIS